MRQARLKAPEHFPKGYYHCISRVVDRQFVLGDVEKDKFVEFMREYESFCGVQVVTFCIMSNHFHILVAVPKRPEVMPTDEELLKRVERLSGLGGGGMTRQMLERFRERKQDAAAEEYREKILARMWDISAFMKLLKQRFTQWFNGQRKRKGTLWEERFKSVLVEGGGEGLATMAAYIDLNPVRANITEDPGEYRWCGYAEAMKGQRRGREGLKEVVVGWQGIKPEKLTLKEAVEQYRVWMFGQGEGVDHGARGERKPGIEREVVARVIEEKGRVSVMEYVRMRVRYFADGAVVGRRKFVEEVFQTFRKRFGRKRKTGARRMKGVKSEELYTLRDLQVDVVK